MSAMRIVLLAVLVCLCLPITGSALMRDPAKPGNALLDGHSDPPLSLRQAAGTPSINALDGHSDPPVSIRSTGRTVSQTAGRRTVTLTPFGRAITFTWGTHIFTLGIK